MRNALMKASRKQGSDPRQWHGALDTVNVDDLSAVQILCDFK